MPNLSPAYCPFWQSETVRSITCEGIIGERSQNVFFTKSEKLKHKNDYCRFATCEKCEMYKAIMIKYKEKKI